MPYPGSVRIIIAEDSRADVLLVEETLRNVGIEYELKVFPDGEQCAYYLRNNDFAPDAIILDFRMLGRSRIAPQINRRHLTI